MSNLATMIMEGSGMGYSAKLDHSYGVDDGAGLIAMESAEALKDIFEAEFYVPNTCTIAAALEGVSVEESSQASVMEASIKGVFQKIKDFFIKLKEKVKDFLHNIKRYLLGIFGSDEKWVSKYEKEIMAIKTDSLKGYKVKMYTYSNKLKELSLEAPAVDSKIKTTKEKMIELWKAEKTRKDAERDDYGDRSDEEIKEAFETEDQNFLDDLIGRKVDPEDIVKEVWSALRSGAESEADKEEVEVVSKRQEFIDTIKKSSNTLNKIDNLISKTDAAYKKAIKFVDDAEKEVSNAKINGEGLAEISYGAKGGEKDRDDKAIMTVNSKLASNYAKYLRFFSSSLSKQQSWENTYITGIKSAMVERNKAYKSALTGVFAYARKNKSK